MKNLFRSVLILTLLMTLSGMAWAKPNGGVVIGYSATWFDGIYPIESYNFEPFTYIARAFCLPRANGDIQVPGGFFDPELEKSAHAHGVKLLISIGGQAENANQWLGMARDTAAEKHFFDTLEKLLADNKYDGVDIDWEPSALTDPDQATYAQFMQDLRARFPKLTITTALTGSEWWAQHISWDKVAPVVDYINLMAYDFSGGWTGHSGHNANLYVPKNPAVDTTLSDDEMVKRLQNKYKVPAGKILLGVPFYGTEFFTKHMGDKFVGDANNGEHEFQYYELQSFVNAKNFKTLLDPGAQAPYLERQDADLVVSYDDPKSIQLKCEYAKNNHLGGIMIWNLGADVIGNQTPLLDAVAKSFDAKIQPMPASGISKTLVAFSGMVKDAYNKLSAAHDKLATAGKADDAKAAEPGPMPDLTVPTSTDVKVLAKKLTEWETALGTYDLKLQDCQAALNSIPAPEVVGLVLHPKKGKKLLVDDFEKGAAVNKLGGEWMTDCDKNNLGTTLSPMPFTPTKGGHKGSVKYAAHISGHFGKSAAPWPYVALTATLTAGGGAVDLSQFKAIEFWQKGDGKVYSLALGRAAVQDYCNFREEFKSTPTWTKVTLKLSDFTQPAWGKQVPYKLSDITNMTFSPGASFSDEDYDLWVDDVTLVK